jgi:putative DNA primase/helicase
MEGIEGVIASLEREAKEQDGTDNIDAYKRWAHRSQAAPKLAAMRDITARMRGISTGLLDFDAHPHLLNVLNGTVDLKMGKLLPHSRQNLLTKLCPTSYLPINVCPNFIRFLTEIMDNNKAMVDFIQRCLGYSLIGDRNDEKLFLVLHGSGANGKSTLLETVRAVLGSDFTLSTPTSTLLKKRSDGIPNDVARLRGARLVTASETNEGRGLDASLVKRLTGGDPIDARFLRGEWFTFDCTFVLWLATNHRPVITDDSEGIWDRVRLVPFDVRIPEGQRDEGLRDRLVATEREGILAWMVQGALDYQAGGLRPPDRVMIATKEYRTEQDPVLTFLAEMCTEDRDNFGMKVRTTELYRAYAEWSEHQEETPIGKKKFNSKISNRGYTRIVNRGDQYWRGISLGEFSSEDSTGQRSLA